jgi:hypothetical protein
VAPSGSSGNHYQLLKTSRVFATGTTAATATDTATGSETDCNLGFYEETLIFQTSNFEILIQGIDVLS